MAESKMIQQKLQLLITTQLDEKQKEQVGKKLKDILQGAAIGFDEAETKKNLTPIIRMIQKLFDKAEMKFDADKLLGMPSQQALQKVADITADEFQAAFDRALAKSGGIKIDFGNIDLSGMTEPLERVTEELAEINRKIANETKKSVDDIDLAIKRLNKIKPKNITQKITEDGVEKTVTKEVTKVEQTAAAIEKTLNLVNNPKALNAEKGAVKALEKAAGNYRKSVENGDPWEIQYQHMVTFVSKYEAMTKKIKPIIDTNHSEFKELYDILSPKAGAAKISLEHFVDVTRGNELSEYKNQPWARESTLKKIEQTLKSGISVKDGGGDKKDDEPPKEPPKPTPPLKPEDGNKKLNTKTPSKDVPAKSTPSPTENSGGAKGVGAQEPNANVNTSAFNQKLFDAIEKLYANFHNIFKQITNEEINPDDEHKVLVNEIKNFLQQFQFKTPQKAGNWLLQKTDRLDEWDSKQIYKSLAKNLKPEDPSWSIEEETITKQRVEAEKIAEANKEATDARKEELGIMKAMEEFQGAFEKTKKNKETLAFVDTKSGKMSELFIGNTHSVTMDPGTSRKMSELGYDMEVHSHSYKTAAPSLDDVEEWFRQIEHIKKFGIRAGEELLAFDFSGFDDKDIASFLQKYKDLDTQISDQFKVMSLDDKVALSLEHGNINEAIQVFMRRGLEEIINTKFPDVMTSMKMPDLPIDRMEAEIESIPFVDVWARATDEIKKVIKEIAVLEYQIDELDKQDKDAGDLIDHQTEIYDSLPKDITRGLSDEDWRAYVQSVGVATTSNTEAINRENEALKENINLKKQAADAHDVLFDKAVKVLEKNNDAFSDYEEMMASSTQESIDEYRKGLDIYQRARRLIEEGYIDQNTEWMDDDGVDTLKSSKSLLPTAEGLEAHTYAPSDEQKEYVLKLGEEYRAIMEILKRGDSEFESALIERARAISKIMYETVRGSDGFLGHQYENAYGGSHQTAVSLEDWQQRDNLLHDVDSYKIDDSQRQAAIDLIYKEIEAEKQLEETRRQAKEAAKQRELDTFQSQYASASAEDKKILYELNELNNEWKRLDTIRDETSHQAALSILEKIREKSNMLEKMNADLFNAYDDVGFKRATPYIEVPSAAPEAAATVNEVSINTEELRNLLNAITYNVKVVQGSEPVEDTKVSIDEAALESVLNRIVYDVKIVHDDADKTANKIALDEGALEATLTRVFSDILNAPTQQNDSEQTEKHWALESTLQTVKGVLDNIQTNTANFGTIKISNVDAIAGSTLEGKLVEIKSVLESIDSKIAKGGVIATRGAVKQANSQPVEPEARAQAARSNMMKSLINDYKTMGKLAAQFADDNNLETKAMLDNLKAEIARKRQSLNLTMDENKSLREKYSIAFDAEKRLLDAAKAQAEIDKQKKQKDKTDKDDWKKRVKDAQRATGVNAATSAVNAGDQTVIRAIGTEGISENLENKARELSDQIKALRVLRDEIDKKGEQASVEDRDNLSKQIIKVKELKTELDGYLKIHEKYSGDNVTDLGDASNFGAVGTNQYWNNITAAIKGASEGRVTIKGLNADTGELTGTTKIAANTFAEWTATVDDGRLKILRTGIKKTETLIESITRKTKEVFTYFSGSSIIFKAFNELKKGVQYVKEIDLALTELKKVTDETEETYDKFLKTAAQTADKVGSTIQKVVSSTADWARLGYSMEQAAKFAETTQVLMNVSEFTDVSQATDALISSVQAFGYTAETSMDVVDLLNTIGNNYAISTADLAQSLTKSSASLVAAGGDLAEAAALTATANKIIQDADSVGTALKTTSLRLRGTDISVLEEEGVDSEGAVTSKSKLQSKVKALSGVDILTQTGEYKSTYEILVQIADVWESMNDMDQAALLELIAGKRNSSVVASLLQNPEELKAAYEDAQNASGSALRENEKYLDSIQGKIDQFNNAVQSLWSNILDADWVKGIFEWVTKIVKSLDTTHGKLLAIVKAVALLMAYKKVNPFDWKKDIGVWMKTVKDGGGLVQWLKSLVGLAPAMKAVTAETVANTIATQANNVADQQAILEKIGLAGATGTLNAATKEAIANNIAKLVTDKAMTVQMGQQTAAMLGYSLSVDAAGKATVAADVATKSFMASNPIGWILLIVSAVMALVMWISQMPSKIEKLTEELNNLKSELRDIQSELDSVNSELETTQDRMSELLAKDKLSFTEKEELDNLKKQNDELQRKLDLIDLEQKQKRNQAAKAFVETMEEKTSNSKEYYTDGSKANWLSNLGLRIMGAKNPGWSYDAMFETQEETLNRLMNEYQSASDERKKEIESEIVAKFDDLKSVSEDVDYFTGDNLTDEQKANNEWLDYINNMRDKWAITSGGTNAKTNAINRIFNKDENKTIKESIDEYVEALKNGDASAKAEIDNIIRNNADLVADLQASGIEISDTVNEASDYFTSFASELQYETIDGKVKEIDEATKRLNGALGNIDTSNIDKIKQALTDKGWVDTEGNLMSDVIAEYFGGEDGGISEKTRAEIERLVKQIYDGKISVQDALKSFELFSVQSVIDIQVAAVKTNFKDIFSDLEDVDGLVDTFEELGSAINSTLGALDALNQAQADYADKGFVSIQTALQLMEYTDDYSSVLEVVDGKLQLVKDAEKNLITARIEAIKVSAQTALADAQAAQKKTEDAISTYQNAMVQETSASVVATAWEKLVAAAAGIKNVLENIWEGGDIGELYNSGYNTYLEKATGMETVYNDAGLQALKDQLEEDKKATQEALDNYNISMELNADNLEDVFKSSDKSTTAEVSDDLFQKEMDYWENRIAANQAKRDQIQNEIDLLEAQGKRAGEEYYKELIALEEERKALLIAQRNEALAYLSTQEEGSEEWWEAAGIVNDLEGEIDDATAAIQDYADAQAQIKWDNLEEITSRFSDLHDEISDLRDILQRDDMFDDDGNWTESGAAVLGTYVYDLEAYKNELATLQSEIADLQARPYNAANAAYLKETYSIDSEQEYNDLLTQWNQTQRDKVKGAYDTADAIKDAYSQQVDAIEDAINEQIDAYNDYIDIVKEAYDAERDLYEFKKDIQKQSRSIAETERRIASLSGSTNKADIAERRKLEAQLAEQRENINDSYYNHANDQRTNALDNEAQAYEESMNRYIETLRNTLEEQTQNLITFTETGTVVTNEFINGVTATVLQNAGIILNKYEEITPYMSEKLKQPWIDASAQLGKHGNDLSVLDAWISDLGYFGKFKTTASGQITTPFVNGSAAASAFKASTTDAMDSIAKNVRSNVTNITSNLSSVKSAYSGIITTANQAKASIDAANAAAAAGASYTGTAANPSSTAVAPQQVDNEILSKYKLTSDQVLALGYGPISLEKFEDLLRNYLIKYSNKFSKAQIWNTTAIERSIRFFGANYVSGPGAIGQYAKGTMGTARNQWMLTDELGDELVMYATPEGTLSYARAGTTVIPADITQNLVEWGKLNPNMMNMPNVTPNINMINNAVHKPEFNFNVDKFLHCDNVTQDSLPELKQFVKTEMNNLVKNMNYAIKGKGGR